MCLNKQSHALERINVNRASISVVVPIVATLLAGCGSSSKSSSNPTATAAAQATSTASATSSTPAATSSTPAAEGASVTTKHNKLGAILAAGPKKLTVYLFEADTGTTSSCTGACATVWPPVTTSGHPRASGGAASRLLGTVKRPGGTMQVTYKGHPLYYYTQDSSKGQTNGEGSKGFGGDWYLVQPTGANLEPHAGSSSSPSPSPSPASGGYGY